MVEMRQTGEMNPEGGARWYASETCFRLYSLLMTNGQEKEGRHEKCPYVDVKYVVSGTMRKENQNRYWPHLALAYGLVSRLEELHQRTGGRTDPFSDSPTDS